MSDHAKTEPGKAQNHPGPDTPRRPGQPGEQHQERPGPSPDSRHPTGPSAPYDSDFGEVAERSRQDPGGPFGEGYPELNQDGLSSAGSVVLSDNGDATSGNGHGCDRDGSKTK